MKLSELSLHNLRNFTKQDYTFDSGLNLLIGPNGSGKTSILEAIYLLSTAHSFRTRENIALIQHGFDKAIVCAQTFDGQSVSLQKSLHQPTVARINYQPCLSSSELAHFLPSQIFYQDLFQIIDAGPSLRRQLLDWGVFHVEPLFLRTWKEYRQALKQRNCLLKQRAPYNAYAPWHAILDERAKLIDQYRLAYFNNLSEKFNEVLGNISSIRCSINYYKGWDRKKEGISLLQVLDEHIQTDSKRQFTQYGSHQADIVIENLPAKAKHYLSRGQQKTVLIALKIAQAKLLKQDCIYLIDDLTSELDQCNTESIIKYIKEQSNQMFITNRQGDNLIPSLLKDVCTINLE